MSSNLPSNNKGNQAGYYAIVLAAGTSTRMGTCKAALPWLSSKSLLSYQVEQFLLAGITPVVVLGTHNCDRQQDCPPATQIAINSYPAHGKVSSILTGLQQLPDALTGVLISAIDQPRPRWIYQALVGAHLTANAPITTPTYRGKSGHPLLLSNRVLPLLQTLSEETRGLRRIVSTFSATIQRVEFEMPTVLLDLNTPEQYELGLSLALNEANGKIASYVAERKANPEHCQGF
jgi:molybdenum cofactor cytidylyltransferase